MANGQAPGLPNGFKTRYSISQLATAGLTPQQPLGNHQQASLLRLDVGTGYQYWYGLPNFYTITRYNHSTHYAMAVLAVRTKPWRWRACSNYLQEGGVSFPLANQLFSESSS